jgi:HK97 gp10 family phage protein
MTVNIEFDFSNIEDEMLKMVDDIAKAEERIILRSAQLVRDRMKQKVNVSDINWPGYKHIKDDIKISRLKDDKAGTKYREIYGGKKTGFKWKYLEYGTTKMNAIPFMQPSLEDTELERQRIAEEELRKAIEK